MQQQPWWAFRCIEPRERNIVRGPRWAEKWVPWMPLESSAYVDLYRIVPPPQLGRRLQAVDVLREAAEEDAAVVEQLEESVGRRRLEVARPHLLRQMVEGLRVVLEEANVEDRLGELK